MAGYSWISDHRGGTAPSWSGCPGHEPLQWPGTDEPEDRKKVWHLLYLRPLSDHWAFLCHSPLCHRSICRGNRADSRKRLLGCLAAGCLFLALFPCGLMVLLKARQDSYLDRQDLESDLPCRAWTAGDHCPSSPYGEISEVSLPRLAMLPTPSPRASWKATIPWMHWQGWLLGSSW